MKKDIFCFLITALVTIPFIAHADTPFDLKETIQKEVASLITQGTKIYAISANSSEKTLQAVHADVIPNWKCPSEFNNDLQLSIPKIFSCYAMVTAELMEAAKSNPHVITDANGLKHKLTEAQLLKFQEDLQSAFEVEKLNAEQLKEEYRKLGEQVSPFVTQLQQTHPDAKLNSALLTLNLKRLVALLGASTNFDFASSFSESRTWDAEQDSAAFMNKYFPASK